MSSQISFRKERQFSEPRNKARKHFFFSQERNFGNVLYQSELLRHGLGAQISQAVLSGISFHATRPAQPISLGAFEPFHDMMIFNILGKNSSFLFGEWVQCIR